MLPDTNKTLFNFTLKVFFFSWSPKRLVACRQECSRQTANTSTFLSMCIPHVVPSQFLVMPISPINVNSRINSLLANYLSAGGKHSQDMEMGKGSSKICFFHLIPHGLSSRKLPRHSDTPSYLVVSPL